MAKLKMRGEHYMVLKGAIERVLVMYDHITLQTYLDQGMSAERFRWDALHCASEKHHLLPERFIVDVLYSYLNDNHIDSALRRITNTK